MSTLLSPSKIIIRYEQPIYFFFWQIFILSDNTWVEYCNLFNYSVNILGFLSFNNERQTSNLTKTWNHKVRVFYIKQIFWSFANSVFLSWFLFKDFIRLHINPARARNKRTHLAPMYVHLRTKILKILIVAMTNL